MKTQTRRKEIQTTVETPAEKRVRARVMRAYEKSKHGPWYGPFTAREFEKFFKERMKLREARLKKSKT